MTCMCGCARMVRVSRDNLGGVALRVRSSDSCYCSRSRDLAGFWMLGASCVPVMRRRWRSRCICRSLTAHCATSAVAGIQLDPFLPHDRPSVALLNDG